MDLDKEFPPYQAVAIKKSGRLGRVYRVRSATCILVQFGNYGPLEFWAAHSLRHATQKEEDYLDGITQPTRRKRQLVPGKER